MREEELEKNLLKDRTESTTNREVGRNTVPWENY